MIRPHIRALLAAIGAMVLVGTVPAGAQAATSSFPSSTTFASAGYADTGARGMFSTASFFFALPVGEVPTGPGRLHVELSHSRLLRPDLSTVTVVANGVSLGSAFLDGTNAEHGALDLEVPARLLGARGLLVEARFHLRLTNDPCEPTDNPALWATVHGTSTLSVVTAHGARDLADLGGILLGRPDGRLGVVVDPSDPAALTAAGTIAAGYGRQAAAAGRDAGLYLASGDDDQPIVVVRRGAPPIGGLPVSWTGTRFEAGDRVAGPDDGVLAVSQGTSPAVLVAGITPRALRRAAAAFADAAAELRGPAVVVSGGARHRGDDDALPWRRGAASFAQLGVDRRDLTGPGDHVVDLFAERPAGWTITRDGRLEIVLDVAPGARRDASFVGASVNGVELGRHRLVADGEPHAYRFGLPAGLLGATLDGRPLRSLALRLNVHLEPVRNRCTPLAVDGMQATLLPTSSWSFPHDTAGDRDLGRFPHPAHTDDLAALVVLPSQPDDAEVEAGLQVMAAIGRWAGRSAPLPRLVTADALGDDERARHGLVLIGDADADLGHVVDVGRPPAISRPSEVTAVLGAIGSPWNSRRSVVVVHGSGAGLVLAARTLASSAGLAGLSGRFAAVAGPADGEATATRLGAASVPPPAELVPVVDEPRDPTPVFASLVGMLSFLAVVGLVAWYRWGKRPRR